jgi:hypothetical protein
MQPEAIDASTPFQPQTNASDPSNASHHGSLADNLHPGDVRDPFEEDRVEPPGSGRPPNASGPESREDTTLPTQSRRLRLDQGNENKPKASFQRISEYENALSPSPPRKPSEGPGFKVIKHKGKSTLDGTEFENFPNGMPNLILFFGRVFPCLLMTNFSQRSSPTSYRICRLPHFLLSPSFRESFIV